MKRSKPPQPIGRPKRAKNEIWDISRYQEYVKNLERYADYLEWRLKTPQQAQF